MLPKQPTGDNRCGAYCLAYYEYLTSGGNGAIQKASQEDITIDLEERIQSIYAEVKFQDGDLKGMEDLPNLPNLLNLPNLPDPKNLKDRFLDFSNPIRMMKWLEGEGWASTFYTGTYKGRQGWDHLGLVELIKGNLNESYNVEDYIEESQELPTDRPGWFIAIWHNDTNMPQHYVLYQRECDKLTSYDPATGKPKSQEDSENFPYIMPFIHQNDGSSKMNYHGVGIWIG